jgi:hypothetical protein
MTDNNNPTDAARVDLDVHPTAPFSPTPAAPTMTWSEAESRKQAMLASAEFRDKLLAGDITSKQEWDNVIQALAYGKVPEPAAPDSPDGLIEWVRNVADVSEDVIEEIRTGRPVTSHERRLAVQRKESRLSDPVFRDAYLNGDPSAKREILLLSVILASPVRDPQP